MSYIVGGEPDIDTISEDYDDFTGYFQGADMVTKLGWKDNQTNSGTVIFNTSSVVEAAHPGIVILGTAGTNNAQASIALCNAGNVGCWRLGGGQYYLKFLVKIPTLSNGTDRFQVYIGLADDKGGATNEECWFTYIDTLNSGQWVGQTRTGGGTITSVSSSIAVTTGWTKLEMIINAAGTSVQFFVGGVSIGTSSTNIPISSGIGPIIQIIKSVGTATRNLYCDLFKYKIALTTAR